MEDLFKMVSGVVKDYYLNSPFYSDSVWVHVNNVAEIARKFAVKNKGDQSIAQIAGLLHDLGSARYGRENHHLTGARDSAIILKSLGFSSVLVAKICHCIYAHRSSVRVEYKSQEAIWVAAADAIDHFVRAEEMIAITKRDLHLSESRARVYLLKKFKRDWQKVPANIKPLVTKSYKRALATIQRPRLF